MVAHWLHLAQTFGVLTRARTNFALLLLYCFFGCVRGKPLTAPKTAGERTSCALSAVRPVTSAVRCVTCLRETCPRLPLPRWSGGSESTSCSRGRDWGNSSSRCGEPLRGDSRSGVHPFIECCTNMFKYYGNVPISYILNWMENSSRRRHRS